MQRKVIMKIKQRKPLFWAMVIICSIALIGFGSGLALAQGDGEGAPETLLEAEELGNGTVSTEEGEESPVNLDENFGRNTQATWIGAHEFQPNNSTDSWARVSTTDPHIFGISGSSGIFNAVVHLPSGALVTSVAFYYYDTSINNLVLTMRSANSQTSNTSLFNFTTPGAVNGYATTTWVPGGGIRITNASGWYYVGFDLPTAENNKTRFWGVRILWHRDIRTGLSHPFIDIGGLSAEFQNSIAALYQSGITTGTSPSTFSPNNPVTRGQFATFFARALGLHWAYPSY
jgi:S-layer homology domain